MKTMLAAKLFEDKVLIVDSEEIEMHKTKYLQHILEPFKHNNVLFVTPMEADRNFELAIGNLKHREHMNPQKVNVPALLRADYVVFTKLGLQQMELILESRQANYYRNKKLPRGELPYDQWLTKRKPKRDPYREVEEVMSDVEIPDNLDIMTPALRSYIKDLKRLEDKRQEGLAAEGAEETPFEQDRKSVV